jgi:hypothetical protein
MTVCTNHLANVDLGEHRLPAAVAQASGDVEVLMPKMVELQDERVGLATVGAVPLAKELDEKGGALLDECPFPAHGVCDVALAMSHVVLPFVGRPARAAVVVSLATCLAAPSKVADRPNPAAATAASRRARLRG